MRRGYQRVAEPNHESGGCRARCPCDCGTGLAHRCRMWRPLGLLPVAVVLIAMLPAKKMMGPQAAAPQPQSAASQGDVVRGDYLVHNVAMCVQCHTPRTHDGTLLMNQQLQGAPMPVSSP